MRLGGGEVNGRKGEVVWEGGEAKRKGLDPFFLSGGPKDAGQPGKKGRGWGGLGR